MILVPVKNLAHAKQRLASVLDQPARTKLAQAMLFDVLQALHTWSNRPEVSVVTSDDYATELARQFNFHTIPDNLNRSETDAIQMATRICETAGVDSTLVIPGDIPLIQRSELEAIMSSAPDQGSVLVPSSDGRGSNAVFRRPAGLFPLRFGSDSFKPHLTAAKATRNPYVVLSLPGIGLDIDSPSDLAQLVAVPGSTHSQRLIRSWGFSDIPVAVNA